MPNPNRAVVGTSGDDRLSSLQNGSSDYMLGLDGDDIFYTNDGDDIVFGGNGNDRIYAGTGTDEYRGGSDVNDIISFEYSFINERLRPGIERQENTSAITFDLAVVGRQNVGGAFGADSYFGLSGVAGGGAADKLFGSNGVNQIYGNNGNDFIAGRGGNDTLYGGEGADRINGGLGGDVIYLGGNLLTLPDESDTTNRVNELTRVRDVVVYRSVAESFGVLLGSALDTADLLLNFDGGGTATDDRIDLSAIDANPFVAGNQAFRFVNNLTAAGVGEVAVRQFLLGGAPLPGYWEVLVDTDRDAAAEMKIVVGPFEGLKLFAGDFIL